MTYQQLIGELKRSNLVPRVLSLLSRSREKTLGTRLQTQVNNYGNSSNVEIYIFFLSGENHDKAPQLV